MKSPLNYSGGKFKLLPQILPLIPETNTFVDLFGGGGTVFANVPAQHHVYNEKLGPVCELIEWFSTSEGEYCINQVQYWVWKYGLSKTNKDGYLELRSLYNSGTNSPDVLYALISHGFNNMIRFNRHGEYNIPFGKNRSSFNDALKKKFQAFVERLQSLDLTVHNLDFYDVPLTTDSFVYADPPYLISTASYNEQDGWVEADEYRLLYFLDYLDSQGLRFALSNVLEHHGQENQILKKWSDNYNVNFLNMTYSNASYHKKDRTSQSVEVLITNYDSISS